MTTPPKSPPRVLVVDDQLEFAENIAEVIQSLGFETAVAASAEEGLARIRQGGITALVTDFKLAGRSGADLIKDMRQAGEQIPALIMSAFTDDRTVDTAHAAGAWMFLPKPVPLGTLMAVMKSLAERPSATLVVDDERNLTENLAEVLASAGYDVLTSTSGAEALAQQRRAETAVIDFRLPDASGIEIARRLRARDPAIRILFISGHTDELRAQLGTELTGHDDIMEKPLDMAAVVSWISLSVKRPRSDSDS